MCVLWLQGSAVTQPSSYLLIRIINSQAASNQHSETHSPLMQFYWSTSTRQFDASPQFQNSSFCSNWTTRNNIRWRLSFVRSLINSSRPCVRHSTAVSWGRGGGGALRVRMCAVDWRARGSATSRPTSGKPTPTITITAFVLTNCIRGRTISQ